MTIKFANGEEHSCSFLSTIPEGGGMRAYIALDDVTFAEAARIFSDPEMTSEMLYGPYRLVDYTTIVYVNVQPYGIQAALTGGHDERRS